MAVEQAQPRPKPDESDLREVRQADLPAVSSALARAFEHNPGMTWIFRNQERRVRQLERGFADYFRHLWLDRGDLYTINSLAGAAVWMPPGGWKAPALAQLRVFPGLVRNVRADLPRFLRFFSLVESKHPHEPHWYLLLLGVAPELQGRGFGSHMMQPVLRRCDEERMPAYLETDSERNVALYERHGFRITEQFDLPSGGPPIWLMWRDPD